MEAAASVTVLAVFCLILPSCCDSAPVTDWTWTRRGAGPGLDRRGSFTSERTGNEPTLLSFGTEPNSYVTRWYPNGTWENLPQSGVAPAPRYGFALGFSAGKMIVANGRNPYFTRFADSFSYDVATGNWTLLSEGPSVRSSAMSCTSVRNGSELVFVFGGDNGQELLDDVGIFDVPAGTYADLSTSGFPSPRCCGVLAPSSNGIHVLFQFGGLTTYNGVITHVRPNVYALNASDVWEVVGDGTAARAPPSCYLPIGWFLPSVAGSDPSQGSVVVGYGQDSGGYLGGLFFLDLSTQAWSEPALQGARPSARSASFFARFEFSGPTHSVFLLYGGIPLNDTRVYTLTAATPAVAVTTSPGTVATTATLPQATAAIRATTAAVLQATTDSVSQPTMTTAISALSQANTATTVTQATLTTSDISTSAVDFGPSSATLPTQWSATSGNVQAASTDTGEKHASEIGIIVGIIVGIVAACCAVAVTLGALIVVRLQKQTSFRSSEEEAEMADNSTDTQCEEDVVSQYATLSFLPKKATSTKNSSTAYDCMPKTDDVAFPLEAPLPELPPPIPYQSTIPIMEAQHKPGMSATDSPYSAMPAEANETVNE